MIGAAGTRPDRWLSPAHRRGILLLAAVIVACALRLQTLEGSLGHDEAYTLEAIASQPYERIVTSYAAPNNHILHSLLVRFSVRLLGTESWTARLPAFTAGILAVPLIFILGRNLFHSSSAGLMAAWLLAVMPVHISYSQVARGYSLSILLAILALVFANKALSEGRNWQWAAFGASGFLGAWTLPSGAFHLVSLGIWCTLMAGPTVRKKAAASTFAAMGLIALVYLPIRAELSRAGGRWGIDVWDSALALPTVFLDTASIWIGGTESLVPAIAACGGVVLIVGKRRDVALYFALAWVVPLFAAAVMGVAGQPRSYLYLLPTFVVAAAYGISQVPSLRLRSAAVVVLLAGYGWSAARSADAPTRDSYGELAQYLQTSRASGDLVVSPFIMDVRIWAYAKETIGKNLIEILSGQGVQRLFIVTSSTDERFRLQNCMLKSNAGPMAVPFRVDSFESIHRSGSLVLNQMRSNGVKVFPRGETTWHQRTTDDTRYVRQTAGAPAVSGLASLRLENPAREPFQLYSSTRFDVPTEGVVIFAFARTVKDSYLSIFAQRDGTDLQRPHMLKTAAWPAVVRGKDGQIWLLEAYLLPVQPQTMYGLYVLGSDMEAQSFADITCAFFPY